MRKLIFSLFSITLFLLFLIQDAALANQSKRELDPDKDNIVNSYSISSSKQWSLKAIDTPNISNPGAGVTIAIIDTGVTKTANFCHFLKFLQKLIYNFFFSKFDIFLFF